MEKRKYFGLLYSFFIFATLFPTMRLLSIGNRSSASLPEFIFSALPDIFAIIVLIFTFIFIYKERVNLSLIPFDWIIILFFVSNVIIGFIISRDVIISGYGFRMTYFPMSFYFVFRFQKFDFIEKSLKLIFYWFLFIGIIGIIIYFFFYDVMVHVIQLEDTEVSQYFIVRMTSVFWSPVVFSTFMAVTFLYFYYQYLTKGKWYFLLFMTILTFCIMLAMSRGVFIAIIISFLLISFLIRNWIKSLYSFLMMVAVCFFTAFYIASPGEVFWWLADSTIDTIGLKKGVTRVDLWLNAFANFKVHPFGYGLGKAGHIAARFFSENSDKADVFSTDGWFLKIMNETGVWGLFSYLLLAAIYFVINLRKKVFTRNHSVLMLYFTIFVMVNIQNIVSNVLDFYLFNFLFWAIIGASVNQLYKKNSFTQTT